MRLLLIFILCFATVGCGTVSPRTEREIALLRAEILDLGDQYGDLKSRHRRALADLASCRGEPVTEYLENDSMYFGDINESYYPEGQIIGNGFVHTGTPDCCAECNRIYSGYGGGEFISEGEVIIDDGMSSDPVIDLAPQPTQSRPQVDPIISPFQDTQPADGREAIEAEPAVGGGETTSRAPRTARERFLARAQQGWTRKAKSNLNRLIPDAEPAFRPDQQWTQRRSNRLPGESNPLDLMISEGDSNQPWQQASTQNPGPISSTPIDDRFLESDVAIEAPRYLPVQQVFIDPDQSFAKDYDQDGGDDGIRLLIQPLDAQGGIVSQGARMTISLIDPNETGEAQRIGLWRFEAYQSEAFVSEERGQRGLLIDLPWQRRTPQNSELVVFVRYITDSGRKLETSLDLTINPPDGDAATLDPVARQPRQGSEKSLNSANVPKWRPVR